jgi:hypothetical protein
MPDKWDIARRGREFAEFVDRLVLLIVVVAVGLKFAPKVPPVDRCGFPPAPCSEPEHADSRRARPASTRSRPAIRQQVVEACQALLGGPMV